MISPCLKKPQSDSIARVEKTEQRFSPAEKGWIHDE
jgi:hypothetical protein